IEEWLLSPNVSVILFTLKLVDIYHLFALHDKVVDVLDHTSGDVRTAALATLKAIYNDSSAEEIIARYAGANILFQREALRTLEVIGSAASLPFLLQQWRSDSPIVKMAAARAVVHCSPEGFLLLEKTPEAKLDPGKAIIQHLKAEIEL
ncbi:MAG: HEAT repeat domain-containing protein, partial [Candidatus Saccharimonadales bacterium]